jgi:hypothetical protein
MQITPNYRTQCPATEPSSTPPTADDLRNPDATTECHGYGGGVSGDVLRGNPWRDNALSILPRLPLIPRGVADKTADVVHGHRNTEVADTGGKPDVAKTGKTAKTVDPTPAILDKLAKLPPAKQLEYVHALRDKSPAKFDALVAAIRAGGVTDQKVLLPVAFELAASTPWGRGADGKPVLDQVRKMYVDGKVNIGTVFNDNLGITHPARESDGRVGGKGTTSGITLNTKLSGAPEALAAVLAHEGLHAYQYARALTPTKDLQVEVGASLVGARVWSELGADKEKVAGKDAQAMVKQMKDEAASYDPKKSADENQWRMELQVATVYSSEYAGAGKRSRFGEGARMINQLLARPDARDVLKAASNSDIKRLFFAYSTFTKARSDYVSKGNWQTLFDLMDQRKLWDK